MNTLSGQSELIEKERIRIEINAQVEEFLRRGGAIQVVTCNAEQAGGIVGSVREGQGEFPSYSE